MKVKAAAKINLMLDVLGVLPNGYHSLFMIMQSVSCCDTVRVDRTKTNEIMIVTKDSRVPTDNQNIAYKAAEAFYNYTGIKDHGIEIEIQKQIPMAAGLAGGSADGAAVLYCLNTLYKTNLSDRVLCEIGNSVGADVPFSLVGGTKLCMHTGDVMAPLPNLQDCYIVLCKPQIDVSTVGAYKAIDTSENLRHADKNGMLFAMAHQNYEMMCETVNNVFEQVIEVPNRPHIKATLRSFGADATLMSGSGPTIYGIFKEKRKAEKAVKALKKEYPETFCTQPVAHSIEVVER